MNEELAALWPLRTFLLEEVKARGMSVEDMFDAAGGGDGTREHLKSILRVEPVTSPMLLNGLARSWGVNVQMFLDLDRSFCDALHSGDYYLAKDSPDATESPT